MSERPEANARWKDQFEDVQQSSVNRELFGIDENQLSSIGIFPKGSLHWKFNKRSKRNWTCLKQVQTEKSKESLSNSEKVKNYAGRFPLSPGEEENGYGPYTCKLEGSGIQRLRKFQRKRTSDFPRYQCLKSRRPEEQRWKMYDSLHCGSVDWAKQILGQTHIVLEKCLQSEQAVESKVGAARSERWSSGKPLA